MTWQAIGLVANVALLMLACLLGSIMRRWQWPANFVGHLVGAGMCVVVLVNLWRLW